MPFVSLSQLERLASPNAGWTCIVDFILLMSCASLLVLHLIV